MKKYAPKKNSRANQACKLIESKGWVSSAELSVLFKCEPGRARDHLMTPVRKGYLVRVYRYGISGYMLGEQARTYVDPGEHDSPWDYPRQSTVRAENAEPLAIVEKLKAMPAGVFRGLV